MRDAGLMERDREISALGAAIAAATRGSGRIVAIEGPAGIGKTRLLGAARALAADAGARVLTARGADLEREFAFGVTRQLLEPALARAEEAERERLLAGAAAPAAFLLGATGAEGEVSFAVLHGLFWLTVNLADTAPLVLVIDDLHWADRPSLRHLAYLAPRLDGLPVLVVVALRAREPGSDDRLIAQIVSDPATEVLTPSPLTVAAVTDATGSALDAIPESPFVLAVHEATGGNPLLVDAVLGALAADGVRPLASQAGQALALGGRAVARRVDLRLAGLPPAAAALADAVAILGRDAPAAVAARLAGLDQAGLSAGRDALEQAGLLQAGPGLAFEHALVAAAVLERTPPTARGARHAEAARLLEEMGAEPERVAAQLSLAPPTGDPQAAAVLRRAAADAGRRGAPDVAYRYLRRCLDEPPAPEDRVPTLVAAGDVAALVDLRAACDLLGEAFTLVPHGPARAGVAILLTRAQQLAGRHREAIGVCDEVLTAGAGDPERELILRGVRAGVRLIETDTAPAGLAEIDELRALPPGDTLGHRLIDAMVAYVDALTGRDREESLLRARRATQDGQLVVRASGGGMTVAVTVALLAADPVEALGFLDGAVAQAHRGGSLTGLVTSRMLRSHAYRETGALGEAEAEARECLRVVDAQDNTVGRPLAVGALAQSLVAQGRVAEARGLVAGIGVPDPPPPWNYLHRVVDALAELALAEGRHEDALAHARRSRDLLAATGAAGPAVTSAGGVAARALAALGRRDDALAEAHRDVALARAWGAPHGIARALTVAGPITGGGGLEMLDEAVALLGDGPLRLDAARAHLELGAALRRQGQRSGARDALRRALDAAEVTGAAPVAERARSELRASGARPRRAALSGIAALTESERRVAELAAAGMTNREIAQELFVTGKTVEVHLTSAYRKLGIRGRRDLAGALTT